MAPPDALQDTVSAPSHAQLALALAIVKLKPANIDIKDHILQIRQHIKSGRDPIRTSIPEKHLDSVAFWQQAYEKSEAAQSKLLDRIYELEQRNEALLVKLEPRASVEQKAQGPGKRKTNGNKATGTVPKRAKTNIAAVGNCTNGGSPGRCYDVLNGAESPEGPTAPFMRQLYTLQSVLQKRPSRSSIVLAAVDLCKSAEKALLSSARETKAPAGRPKTSVMLQSRQPDLRSLLHALEHSNQLLCQALNKLSGTVEGIQERGQVIYHLVSLFETVMRALQLNSRTRAEEALVKLKSSKKQKKGAKSKLPKTALKPETSSFSTHEEEPAMQISSLLSTMVLSLNPSRAEHRNLLEGYLFILLSRVGKILCVFVFRDLVLRPDLRTDSTRLPLPAGLTETSLDDINLQATEIEAKYLVWLLERTMPLVDTFYGPSQSRMTSEARDSGSLKELDDVSLLSRAKRKLQNTLYSAVFGDDDPVFKDSLKGPELPGKALEKLRTCAPLPEKTIPEWFTQEVFTLLGWNVLMRRAKE